LFVGRVACCCGRSLNGVGKLGQRAFHVKQGLPLHWDHSQLPGRGEASNCFADFRPRGQRRQKNLHFIAGGGNGRLKIKRDEHRKRGHLRHVRSGVERLLLAGLKRFPEGGLAVGLVERGDAHRAPELIKRTQSCGFGELAADLIFEFVCTEDAFAFQHLPHLLHEWRDARGAGARRVLPVAVAAHCEDERQRIGADNKVGVVGGGAEQIQGDGKVSVDKPRKHLACGFDRCARRSRVGLAEAGLNKGGRRRIQLCLARQEKAKASLLEKCLGVFERQNRVGVLPPANRACCL